MTSTLSQYSAQQLRRAAEIKEKIDSLQLELERLTGSSKTEAAEASPGKRRRFTAATIEKMRASQKARWAAVRGPEAAAEPAKARRRTMSAAAKAQLSAIAKARWKKAHAAGKSRL